MKAILSFFDFLIETVRTVWDFFIGLINNLITFVELLGGAVSNATQCVLAMPTWLQVFALGTITVSVIYLVIGRESGKSAE